MSNTHEWVDCGDGRKIYRKIDVFIPNQFGVAPTVIFDSMPEEYHNGVCRPISSRKEWEQADKESSSVTLSPQEWKRKRKNIPALKRAKERELQKDRRNASVKAMNAYKENPQAVEEKLKARAEEQQVSAKENQLTSLIEESL